LENAKKNLVLFLFGVGHHDILLPKISGSSSFCKGPRIRREVCSNIPDKNSKIRRKFYHPEKLNSKIGRKTYYLEKLN
jgi:hypothetical protein